MKKKTDLIQAIRRAAKSNDVFLAIRAKVESVDESDYTIRAISTADEGESDAPVYTASIRASVVTGDLGFIAVPEKGSIVFISFAHNSEQQAVVIACSKIAKVIITVKTQIELKIEGSDAGKIKIDTDGIDIGGAAEPIVLGDTLKGWCDDVYAALDAIIQWGATGVEGTGGSSDVGGIAPLSGITAPSFPVDALSKKHKAD